MQKQITESINLHMHNFSIRWFPWSLKYFRTQTDFGMSMKFQVCCFRLLVIRLRLPPNSVMNVQFTFQYLVSCVLETTFFHIRRACRIFMFVVFLFFFLLFILYLFWKTYLVKFKTIFIYTDIFLNAYIDREEPFGWQLKSVKQNKTPAPHTYRNTIIFNQDKLKCRKSLRQYRARISFVRLYLCYLFSFRSSFCISTKWKYSVCIVN